MQNRKPSKDEIAEAITVLLAIALWFGGWILGIIAALSVSPIRGMTVAAIACIITAIIIVYIMAR